MCLQHIINPLVTRGFLKLCCVGFVYVNWSVGSGCSGLVNVVSGGGSGEWGEAGGEGEGGEKGL